MKKNKHLKDLFYVTGLSLLLAIILTITYSLLPPFYINSVNIAIVPELEVVQEDFGYNGFYQSETSQSLVSSLSLFASSGDFKQALEKDLGSNIVYLLSKTNGKSIVTLKIVTLDNINIQKASESSLNNVEKTLEQIVPENLNYEVKSLDEFNYSYTGEISKSLFFTISLGAGLVFFSLIFILKEYYKS